MRRLTNEIDRAVDDEERTPKRRHALTAWFRALGRAAGGAPRSQQTRLLEELEVELSLLREENARLKLTRKRARDRPVHERVRELLPPQRADVAGDGEPWDVLADCWLLRDDLTDACREIERGVRATRKRLESLPLRGDRAIETTDDLEHAA